MATVIVIVVTAVFAVEAQSSIAASVNYCEKLIDPNTLCRDGAARHSYGFNQASYLGTGSVPVCEKVVKWDLDRYGSSGVVSYLCNINYVSDVFWPASYLTYPYAQNASSARHTIYGYAEW